MLEKLIPTDEQLKEIAYFINFNFNADKHNSLTNMAIQVKLLAKLFDDKKRVQSIEQIMNTGSAGVNLSILEAVYYKFLNTQLTQNKRINIHGKIYTRYDLANLITEAKSKLYETYQFIVMENNVKTPFDWGLSQIRELQGKY